MGAIECLHRREGVEDRASWGHEEPEGWDRQHDPARMRRREVAAENGQLVNRWPVPVTVLVTPSDCSTYSSMSHLCGVGMCVPAASNKVPLISFSGLTTADAVLQLAALRHLAPGSICVMNFANGCLRSVGGGYRTGAQAQEEDLCRRIPGLYPSLCEASEQGLYPFGPSTYESPNRLGSYSDVLFTQDVTVARLGERDNFQLLDPAREVQASVVSAAAPNVGFASEAVVPELVADTVRSVFLAPKKLQPTLQVLILGAWGCGAFGGDANQMASIFATAITQKSCGNLYDEIHFAIPKGTNARIFMRTMRDYGLQPVEL